MAPKPQLSGRAALLQQIAEADISGGGNKIRDGRGRLAVKKLSLDVKFKGNVFIAEFVVVNSTKIPVVALKSEGEVKEGQPLDIEPNAPGTECSYVCNLTKHIMAFQNVKNLVLKLFDANEDETSSDELLQVLDEVTAKNSAYGMLLDYETYRKLSNENNVEMVLPKWTSVQQTPEQIQQVRIWLENLALQQATAAQPPPHTDADAPRH